MGDSWFYTRDQLHARSCEGNDPWIDIDCRVYESTYFVDGTGTGQLKPFTEDNHIDGVNIFVAPFFREFNLTYSKNSKVFALDTFQYEIPESFTLASDSHSQNSKFRVDEDGFLQLTTSMSLNTGVGRANLGYFAPSYLAMMAGLPSFSTDDSDTSMMGHWEPIVGIPVQLNLFFGFYLKFTYAFVDTGLYSDIGSSKPYLSRGPGGIVSSTATSIIYP